MSRERKYFNTWSGCSRAHDQKTLPKHSYCIPFVILTICYHFAFNFMRFQSCNWTVAQFYCFPERKNFRFNFGQLLIFRMCWKSLNVFLVKLVFISENRFALTITVFEKIDVKNRVPIRSIFNFYAAVALLCWQGRSKKLILFPLLVLIPT